MQKNARESRMVNNSICREDLHENSAPTQKGSPCGLRVLHIKVVSQVAELRNVDGINDV
jgi:hypothetical protein